MKHGEGAIARDEQATEIQRHKRVKRSFSVSLCLCGLPPSVSSVPSVSSCPPCPRLGRAGSHGHPRRSAQRSDRDGVRHHLGEQVRSALTVLGVVIGSRRSSHDGDDPRFDQSLRDLIAQSGPNIIYLQRFGVTSIGTEFKELLKRPDLTASDARALDQQSTLLLSTWTWSWAPGRDRTRCAACSTGIRRRKRSSCLHRRVFAEGTRLPMLAGRFFNGRRPVPRNVP